MWLKTFCGETGVRPEFVYVAPSDRLAANEGRLPFYPREWPENAIDRGQAPQNSELAEERDLGQQNPAPPILNSAVPDPSLGDSHNLKHDLSAMHFRAIKLRTLRGALRSVLNSAKGV